MKFVFLDLPFVPDIYHSECFNYGHYRGWSIGTWRFLVAVLYWNIRGSTNVSHVMRTHAFNKHPCWCRSGMNPHEPTPSRVKSALFVNIMRRKKKEIISCAVPWTSLTELSSSKVIWTTKAFYSQQVARSMTCRRKTRRQTVDWVTCYAGAVLCMLIPKWSATSRHFFIWQTRRAEQATMHIRWHTEREPTSSVRRIGSPRDSLAMRLGPLHFLCQS